MKDDKERIRQHLNVICNKTIGLRLILFCNVQPLTEYRCSTTLYNGKGGVMKSVTVQFVLFSQTCHELLHVNMSTTQDIRTFLDISPCPTRHQLRECSDHWSLGSYVIANIIALDDKVAHENEPVRRKRLISCHLATDCGDPVSYLSRLVTN